MIVPGTGVLTDGTIEARMGTGFAILAACLGRGSRALSLPGLETASASLNRTTDGFFTRSFLRDPSDDACFLTELNCSDSIIIFKFGLQQVVVAVDGPFLGRKVVSRSEGVTRRGRTSTAMSDFDQTLEAGAKEML